MKLSGLWGTILIGEPSAVIPQLAPGLRTCLAEPKMEAGHIHHDFIVCPAKESSISE